MINLLVSLVVANGIALQTSPSPGCYTNANCAADRHKWLTGDVVSEDGIIFASPHPSHLGRTPREITGARVSKTMMKLPCAGPGTIYVIDPDGALTIEEDAAEIKVSIKGHPSKNATEVIKGFIDGMTMEGAK